MLNFFRSVDTLVYALVFVAAVGLGPFPGVLAVIAYTTTSLAKLYSEAIEGIERGPVDAITATGATRLQVLRFGVLPQVLPLFLSYVLYRLETNIRAATILGFVGAGGIGFYLQTYLRMIDYPAASTVLLVTVVMVMLVDAAQLPPPREAHLAASTSNRRLHRDGREGDRGGLWDSFPPKLTSSRVDLDRRPHRDGREGDRGGLWDSFPPRRDFPRRVDGAQPRRVQPRLPPRGPTRPHGHPPARRSALVHEFTRGATSLLNSRGHSPSLAAPTPCVRRGRQRCPTI